MQTPPTNPNMHDSMKKQRYHMQERRDSSLRNIEPTYLKTAGRDAKRIGMEGQKEEVYDLIL